MPRTTLLVTLIGLWLIHLTVTTVHAQQARDAERAPAPAREERPGRPHHTGLLIAGVTMLFTSYLVAAFVGGIVSGIKEGECKGGDVADCNKPNLMLIPVVGPLLPTYDPLDPIVVKLILAGPQIVGAVLAVAGIYQASRPARRRERASLDVYAVPLPAGGMLAAKLRF